MEKAVSIDLITDKISQLEGELKELKDALIAARSHDREQKTSTLLALREEKEKLLDELERKSENAYYEKVPQKIKVARNFTDLQYLLSSKISEPKYASVILTCVMEIIATIENSEFDDVHWMMKVSEAKKIYGARIRFTHLNTRYEDLKNIFRKKVSELNEEFKLQKIEIVTKTKTSPGEVVDAVEFTFKFSKTISKAHALSRMLAQGIR